MLALLPLLFPFPLLLFHPHLGSQAAACHPRPLLSALRPLALCSGPAVDAPGPACWLLFLLRSSCSPGLTGSRLPPPTVRGDSTPLSGVRSPARPPQPRPPLRTGVDASLVLGLTSGRLSWVPPPPVPFHRSSGRPVSFVHRLRRDASTSARSEAVAWSPGSPLRPRCSSCLSLPRGACLAAPRAECGPPAFAADAWCWPQGPGRLPRVSPSVRV